MTRRYAEGTEVDVEKSIKDLRRLAERYDADEFTYAMSPRGGSVMFRIKGIPVRYDAAFPTDDGLTVKQAEAEWRRRWRVILLRSKAQFETMEDGELSPTRAFLSDMMLDDGRTLGAVVEEGGIERLAGDFLPQLPMPGSTS